MSESTDPQAILDFWFGAPHSTAYATPREVWFKKDESFDQSVADRFGTTIEQALRGELDPWAADADGALAHILLLDQFTRNAFRGDKRAFAGDAQALAAASAAVGARFDEQVPPFKRFFFYMPFEHCEGLAMQDESVRLFTRLVLEAPDLTEQLGYAERHRDVIERFGRFPHRNAILGRQSTAEELAYLAEPGSGF